MNIRRIVLFGLFLILLPIAITILKTNQSLQKTASNANFLNDYKKQLEQEEARIWTQLEKVGIPRADFDKKKKIIQNEIDTGFKEEASQVSASLTDLVKTVCQNMHFDKPFNIRSSTEAKGDYSTSKIFYLYEKDLIKCPVNAQKWVIAHELMHMMFNDSISHTALKELIKEKNLQNNIEIQKILNDYKFFYENRADFHAACINREYVQGFKAFTQYRLENYKEIPNNTHPAMEARLENANLLILAFLPDAEKNNFLEQNIKQPLSKEIHYV